MGSTPGMGFEGNATDGGVGMKRLLRLDRADLGPTRFQFNQACTGDSTALPEWRTARPCD